MNRKIDWNKIDDSSQSQTINNVLDKFFSIENLLSDNNPHIKEWIIIKLVTIIEQLCRQIIKYQIENDKYGNLPEKLSIDIKDLDRVKEMSIGFLIASQSSFQNVDGLKKLTNYEISNILDNISSNDVNELFKTRHELVHTTISKNYDIKKGYNVTRQLIQNILKQSEYGITFYDIMHGDYFNNLSKYDEALKHYNDAIKKNSNDPRAHYNIGAICIINGDHQQAYDHACIVTNSAPDNVSGYILKGYALENQNNSDEAINCYNKAIKLDFSNITAHDKISRLLFAVDNLKDALIEAKIVLKLEPDNFGARLNIALILMAQKKYDDVLLCLNEQIKLFPQSSNGYYGKYIALSNLGRSEEAKENYEKAIEIEPHFIYHD